MKTTCIFGKNSTICQNLLPKLENYDAYDSTEFDVTNFEKIFSYDFSKYHTVINFAGHSKGSYKSPIENNWQNYENQIQVNFISNVMLAKKFLHDNKNGRYLWFSSILTKNCRPYQSVYGASKLATEYVFDKWSIEYPTFKFINIRLGRTKTNHLFNTFEGLKDYKDVEKEYQQSPYLKPDFVARKLLQYLDTEKTITVDLFP